jgi:hypothetical protein
LDEEYNPVFTAIVARANPISPSELNAQLLSFEQHTALQAIASPRGSSSALSTSCSRGHPGDHGHGCGKGCGRSSRGGVSSKPGRGFGGNSSRPQCQACLKFGHTANKCWHPFNEDYVLEPRTTAATSSSGIDNNWYMDSGATDHITGDLYKLTMHNPFAGTDQIHATNGKGMDITHVGKTVIPTPAHNLVLDNVLHVPSAHKNLISVHCFTLDNDIFI